MYVYVCVPVWVYLCKGMSDIASWGIKTYVKAQPVGDYVILHLVAV